MSHEMLRPFLVKVSVLDYFPLLKSLNLNLILLLKHKFNNK